MRFSIVIATIDREELLLKAVNSILKQTYKDYEIIIIDQSNEKSRRIPDDPRIVYTHILQKGLSHARNIAIKEAKGDVIGLMDDDAEYSIDVLEKVYELYKQNESVLIVSGIIIDPSTRKVSLKGMPSISGTVNYWNVLNRCISPSLFIRKSFFESERFDEEFGVGARWGSGEETDVVLRCMSLGGRVIYSPEIRVFHPAVCKRELPFEKLERYSKGFGALAQKHKIEYHNYVFYMRCVVVVYKQILGVLKSALSFDAHMIKYYWISYKYKRKGMQEYRREHKKR